MRNITLTLLALIVATISIGQNTVTGTVTNYEGALPYATISIKGSDTGVVADKEGKFSIDAQKGATLIVSYVGHTDKEIVVSKKAQYQVELEHDSLDEVIVVAQGIKRVKIPFNCMPYRCIDSHSCNAKAIGVKIENEETVHIATSKLFPNPSSNGYFNLSFSESYKENEITVISITGQVVFSKSARGLDKNISLDLSTQPPGVYIINILADGKRLPAQKAIKS